MSFEKISKSVPLTKDEVLLLIQLIETEKVIIIKGTNSSSNQLKDAAWFRIAQIFNASVSSGPRTSGQLRLKWENLKKNARKKFGNLRTSHIQDGGKQNAITSNDILGRVASLLTASCDDQTAELDSESMMEDEEEIQGQPSIPESFGIKEAIVELKEHTVQPLPKNIYLNPPSAKLRRTVVEDDLNARIARNKAITEYYQVKKRKLEAELEFTEMNLNKIKIELQNVELKNMKLKAEINNYTLS